MPLYIPPFPEGGDEEENKAVYIKVVQSRLNAIGITNIDEAEIGFAYEQYRAELAEHEATITKAAGEMTRSATPVAKGATLIEQLKSDSNLTILDGGPGAGKSYSLGQAMLQMDRTVVCLGSTPTAAAGLKKDMEDVAKGVKGKEVYGGQTVDAFLDGLSDDPSKEELEAYFKEAGIPTDPMPLIMVDEAGLLNHKQMAKLMKVSALINAKLILAGDCKQIPNGNEQPFKLLVDAYEHDPAVYANAPYINRAGMFFENVITNGVYSEKNRDFNAAADAFGSDKAVEYLTAGLQLEDTGFSKLGPFVDPNIPSLTLKMDAQAVKDFFDRELAPYAKGIKEKGEGELKRILTKKIEDLTDEASRKEYLAAVFIAHEMGVRAYETLGYMTGTEHSKGFGDMQSADEQLKMRLTNEFAEAPWNAKNFSENRLLITATEAEAQEMNKRIRAQRAANNPDFDLSRLNDGEPVVLKEDLKDKDGNPILDPKGNPYKKGAKVVVDDSLKAVLDGHENLYQFGYAMDVKATQGMSQKGKVVFMVTEQGAQTMQGGEILVGISRNKGEGFEIAISNDVDKERFYANSVKQQAEYRCVGVGSAEKLQSRGMAGDNEQIRQATTTVAGNDTFGDAVKQKAIEKKIKTI